MWGKAFNPFELRIAPHPEQSSQFGPNISIQNRNQETTRRNRVASGFDRTLKRKGFIMGTIRACCCLALVAACAFASAAFAQTQATQSGPVPPAIASAKTVFVSNAGSDSGLFPEPFTGDPGRPYAQFYSALKGTGDFILAGDPSPGRSSPRASSHGPLWPHKPQQAERHLRPLAHDPPGRL